MAPETMTVLATGQRSIFSILYHAIMHQDISHGVSVRRVSTPIPSDTELLVKVHTAAQNPTDWKHIDYISPANSIIGCDYSGVVTQVGARALGDWKVGDRIAGVIHGGIYPDKGSYAEYLKVEGDLAWKVPANVTDHEAATYGISATTAMMGLYMNLDVPWPDESRESEKRTIFIYAGSTAASLFAIQMAKAAGWQVVTTCSTHSFELVKKYGADAVFDYNDPKAVEEIKAQFPGITRAFDGYSAGRSAKFCCDVVREKGGKVVVLDFSKSRVPGVEVKPIMMYTLMGQPFQLMKPIGPKWGTNPEDRAGLVRFYKMLPELVEKTRPPPTELINGGFEGLCKGLDLLRKGKVSGKKLVLDLEQLEEGESQVAGFQRD